MMLMLPAAGAAAPSSAQAIPAAVADTRRSPDNVKLDVDRRPAEVLAFAAIKPGSTVIDWGAGGGYYSELLADVVGPRGSVVAAEPDYAKLDGIKAVAAAHTNVTISVAPVNGRQLAPLSADVIFSHLTFHDLYLGTLRGVTYPDPQAMLAGWHAALRPRGLVVIADHIGAAGDTTVIAQTRHRIAVATVKAEMARAGFELVGQSDVLHRNDDDIEKLVFDPAVRGHTDRMLLKFRKK
jgi:predicted methyltransferase